MKQDEMLIKILYGNIGLIQTYINKYDCYNSECEVLITPGQIKKILIDYLDKKISAKELQVWADFLCFNDALTTQDHDDEDHYESMWYVLQRISTPLIDGEINFDNISKYLSELNEKYPYINKNEIMEINKNSWAPPLDCTDKDQMIPLLVSVCPDFNKQ